MNNDKVKDFLMKHSIQCVFRPLAASHMNLGTPNKDRSEGLNSTVTVTLPHKYGYKLDDECLQTLMYDVECITNARPPTTVSSDADPLTNTSQLTNRRYSIHQGRNTTNE